MENFRDESIEEFQKEHYSEISEEIQWEISGAIHAKFSPRVHGVSFEEIRERFSEKNPKRIFERYTIHAAVLGEISTGIFRGWIFRNF